MKHREGSLANICLLLVILTLFGRTAFPQCTCFAQLKYRSVDIGVVPSGYNHAFWWIGTSSGLIYTIDGGPAGSCPFSCGRLIDWFPQGNTGNYPQDTNTAPSAFISVGTAQLCNQVDSMYSYAYFWNSTTNYAYVLAGNPNSNTFAHKLGSVGGGFLTLPTPPGSIGW